MPSAEIITIGTEILLGEIVDTNTRFLAQKLREQGIDLYRQTTVGDNIKRISQAIQASLPQVDVILTTGGLGPTVDDPSRQAVAAALGIETEFRPDLWDQIQERYRRFGRTPTENNQRQAYVPQGAIAVENPVGTAPAFIVETPVCAVISLPGVPREMEYLMENKIIPYLHQRLDLHQVIVARLIHTAGAGESQIDSLIGDLEQLSNPTVGLAAHAGRVDVRITAKAASEDQAQVMITKVEQVLRERLGKWVYGIDQETLEQVALANIETKGWKLAVIESGLKGDLIHRLASCSGAFLAGEILTAPLSLDELVEKVHQGLTNHQAEIIMGVTLLPGEKRQEIFLVCRYPGGERQIPLSYGGPPGYASTWTTNQALDLLRKI